MKYKCCFILLFVLFPLFSSMDMIAETYIVTASRLNVRQKPTKKSRILFKLNKGSIVESTDSGKWVEILYDGKRGYVYKKYLTVQKAEKSKETMSFSIKEIGFWGISYMCGMLFVIIFLLVSVSYFMRLSEALRLFCIPQIVFILICNYFFDKPFVGSYIGLIVTIWIIVIQIIDNIDGRKQKPYYQSDEEDTWETPSSDSCYTPSTSYYSLDDSCDDYDDDDNYKEDNSNLRSAYEHYDIFRSAHGDPYYIDENGNTHWLNDETNGFREIGTRNSFNENGDRIGWRDD